MAYDRKRLARIGPNLLTYKTEDAAATVDTAAYFNEKGSPLKINDVIMRITVTNIDTDSEAASTAGFHLVNSVTITAGTHVIDVADALAVTVTDTD